MNKHRRPRPAWLMGLVIAVVAFLILLLLASAIGFGDDPVLETVAAISR